MLLSASLNVYILTVNGAQREGWPGDGAEQHRATRCQLGLFHLTFSLAAEAYLWRLILYVRAAQGLEAHRQVMIVSGFPRFVVMP